MTGSKLIGATLIVGYPACKSGAIVSGIRKPSVTRVSSGSILDGEQVDLSIPK